MVDPKTPIAPHTTATKTGDFNHIKDQNKDIFTSRPGSRNEEKESGVNEQVTKSSDINNRVSSVDINCKPHVTLTQQPTQLAGRLQHFITCWEKLTSDSVILEFVKCVKIEFPNGIEPTQNIGRTCNFNVREQVIVESEIQKLIQKGVIIPSVHEGEDSSPLSSCVARKTGHTVQY